MDEKKFGKDINVRGKELTDEEIVKDVERSTGMPSYWKKIVLDLINRQKAEIERLTSSVLKYAETLGNEQRKSAELQKQVDEQDQEIDRLEKVVHDQAEQYYDLEQRTAKEICALAVQNWHGYESDMENFMLALKERYGVEVEW